MSAPLLAIENLTLRHGKAPVLTDISMRVDPGEIVALLGANGAGKSTLLRAIMGFHRPDAGTITFTGVKITDVIVAARARLGLGYCPEGRRVFAGMSVRDNLDVASHAGRAETRRRRGLVYHLFPDLPGMEDTPAWQLSGGQQQMVAIGRALMTGPKLLLLDEPSLGLSPMLAAEMLKRVRAIAAEGTAVLLAEQNIVTALDVAARAYLLDLGRVADEGPSASLRARDSLRATLLGGATPP
jgi:branched-chain amino acid transport system ATP-binding protein